LLIIIILILIRGVFRKTELQNAITIKLDLSSLVYVPTREYIISQNELSQKKLDALRGDIKAALTVSYHYVHGYYEKDGD